MTRMHCRLTAMALLGAVAWTSLARAQTPQPIAVSGKVVNETGQPMQGASVSLVGLGMGAMTAEDGRYAFSVPAARASGQTATLEARRLGYKPVSVQVTLTAGTPITHDFTLVDRRGTILVRHQVPQRERQHRQVDVDRHPAAQAALKLMGVKTASELAQVIVSVGLAQNLAALRALATEGIQRGHMALHARSVAIAAELDR